MNSPRYRIPLLDGWTFRQSKVNLVDLPYLEDLPSAQLSLPHSWNTADTFREDANYRRGWGSYSHHFHIPMDLTQGLWYLVTDGFYGTGDLSANGIRVAPIDGQYLGLNADITEFIHPGRNQVGIRLTNRCASHVLPGIDMPDFILYGGLSGRAWLEYRPLIHLDTSTWQLNDHAILTDAPSLSASITVNNRGPGARQVTIATRLHSLDGRGVLSEQSTPVTARTGIVRITQPLSPGPLEHWSPDNPRLYCLTTELWLDGALVDQAIRKVGFRQAIFQPGKGFHLNGRRLPLRGVNRHEEIPGFGRAMPPALHADDVKTIRAMGCNFVRLSHYPQSPEFLDACDAHGLLVFPEIASWKSVRTGAWLRSAVRQMTAMIRRDRHHPSIILWGMGNESRSRPAFDALGTVVRNEDPIRPTIYAENHLYRARRAKTIGLPDIWGLNYELDELPQALSAGALKNVIVSECSNHPHAERGHLGAELEQLTGLSTDLALLEGQPGVAGFCLWSFADYATLRKKRYRRFCGMVDAWRLPKLAFYLLQARHSTTPVLHVTGAWSARDTAATRSILIITNGRPASARLTSSKKAVSLSSLQEIAPHCWTLTIPFQNESLELMAAWAEGSRATILHPWHTPALIKTSVRSIPDEGRHHLSEVDIAIVDAAGHPCLDWEGSVTIHVPDSYRVHTCFPDNRFHASNGLGRTYVSGPEGLVNPTVFATASPDLRSRPLPL